jgi:hypothetical protein
MIRQYTPSDWIANESNQKQKHSPRLPRGVESNTTNLQARVLINWHWRRLFHSLTRHNEYHKLELSKVWEPSDSSKPLPIGKEKAAPFSVSHGNPKYKAIPRQNKNSTGVRKHFCGGTGGQEWGIALM